MYKGIILAKLLEGDIIPDFSFQTPFTNDRNWHSELEKNPGKTALIFLRYYGCTLCQLDIRDYALDYHNILASGGKLYIVLQSDPQKIAKDIEEKALPFEIICDPSMNLYKEFEIPCAKSMASMADAKTVCTDPQKLDQKSNIWRSVHTSSIRSSAFVTTRQKNLSF